MKKVKLSEKNYILFKFDYSKNRGIVKSKKLIMDTLYEEFQKLIPKSTIKKALKKVELF